MAIPVVIAARAFLGGISPKVWLAIGVVAALLWMAHSTRVAKEALHKAQAAAAADEAQALRASIAETERRAAAHQEIASAAEAKSIANARAAAAARAAADRVRDAAAAFAASAAARGAAPAGDCTAAGGAIDLLAELLGRTANRAAELADLADRAQAAGKACEASYDALKGKP